MGAWRSPQTQSLHQEIQLNQPGASAPHQGTKMKTAKFVFDGIEGYVNKSGFMHWATFYCDMSHAIGGLKEAVEKAYKTLK